MMALISLIIANLLSLVDARIFRMVVTSILGLCTVESSATRVERAFDLRSSSSASFLFKSTWKQVKTIEALVFTYYTIILFNFFSQGFKFIWFTINVTIMMFNNITIGYFDGDEKFIDPYNPVCQHDLNDQYKLHCQHITYEPKWSK